MLLQLPISNNDNNSRNPNLHLNKGISTERFVQCLSWNKFKDSELKELIDRTSSIDRWN